jgi:hypothetical protein
MALLNGATSQMRLDGIGGSPTGKQRLLDARKAAMLSADKDPRPDAVDRADGVRGGRRLVRQGMGNGIGLKMPPTVDLRAEPIGQLILDDLQWMSRQPPLSLLPVGE